MGWWRDWRTVVGGGRQNRTILGRVGGSDGEMGVCS